MISNAVRPTRYRHLRLESIFERKRRSQLKEMKAEFRRVPCAQRLPALKRYRNALYSGYRRFRRHFAGVCSMQLPGKFVKTVAHEAHANDDGTSGVTRVIQMDIPGVPGSSVWKEAFREAEPIVQQHMQSQPKPRVRFIDLSGQTITP